MTCRVLLLFQLCFSIWLEDVWKALCIFDHFRLHCQQELRMSHKLFVNLMRVVFLLFGVVFLIKHGLLFLVCDYRMRYTKKVLLCQFHRIQVNGLIAVSLRQVFVLVLMLTAPFLGPYSFISFLSLLLKLLCKEPPCNSLRHCLATKS